RFDLPWPFAAGLAVAAILLLSFLHFRRRGFRRSQTAVLLSLRAAPFLTLLFLAARPNWFTKNPPDSASRSVVLLMDRSESMALEVNSSSRYHKAVEFLLVYCF